MCVRVACTAVSYQTSVTFRTHSNIVVKCVTFSSAWPREAYLRQVGGHNSYQRVPYLALLRVYPDTFFACFYPGTVVLPNHSLQHFLFFPDCSVNIISPPPRLYHSTQFFAVYATSRKSAWISYSDKCCSYVENVTFVSWPRLNQLPVGSAWSGCLYRYRYVASLSSTPPPTHTHTHRQQWLVLHQAEETGGKVFVKCKRAHFKEQLNALPAPHEHLTASRSKPHVLLYRIDWVAFLKD